MFPFLAAIFAAFLFSDAPCVSTTMDGLPNCPRAKMTAAECLRIFPPDQAGGYCEWYGDATKRQADDFERRRGFRRVTPTDGSSDLWKPVTKAARASLLAWRKELDARSAESQYYVATEEQVHRAFERLTVASIPPPGYWPLPASEPGIAVACSECIESHANKLTPGYPNTILTFTGRFGDSQATGDFQQPFKTARFESVLVKNGRIYFQIGSAIFAYNEATFFSRLTSGEQMVPANNVPVSNGFGWTRLSYPAGAFDEFLFFDAFFYAETSQSGWAYEVSDGQRRLFGFDVDDRGLVYPAYSVFGWGIVRDTLASDHQIMPSLYQDPTFVARSIAVVKTSDGRYVALVNNGGDPSTNTYDVTDPAHVSQRLVIPKTIAGSVKSDAMDRIAILGNGTAEIYTSDNLASGAAPIVHFEGVNLGKVWGVACDGANFYATSDTGSELVISKFSAPTYARTDYHFAGAFAGTTKLHYGDGYLVWSGSMSGSPAMRVFKITDGAPVEIQLSNYFQRYYAANPDQRYTHPNFSFFLDSTVAHVGTHTYLIATAYSLGDVYELPPDGFVPPPTPTPTKCQTVPVGCTCDQATGVITCPPPPPPVPVGCPTIKPGISIFIGMNGEKSGCNQLGGTCSAGESIDFRALTFNYDLSCSTHSFRWDFGDGGVAFGLGQSTSHVFNAGHYTVTLNVIVNGTSTPIQQAIEVVASGRRRAVRP